MDYQHATLEGLVTPQIIAAGSKSERVGLVLRDQSGRILILRRQGGPAFGDAVLDALSGHIIKAEGILVDGGTFIMKSWKRQTRF